MRQRFERWAVLGFALVLAGSRCAAADEAFVRRAEEQLGGVKEIAARLPNSRAERAMLEDARDGRWDEFDLLSAAIVAQGDSPAGREQAARRLERHASALRRQLAAIPRARQAETLFAYLHEHVLTGRFAADCHSIERTLRTGDYNCLSGTVLFVGLAERCGVAANAVLAPSHVHARATIGGIVTDIETTAPQWFREPASRREELLAAALSGGSAEIVPRVLGSVELLAVVYYNRGVEAFGRRDYPEAAANNLVALRLDSRNGPAGDNLLAAVNNWALQTAKGGDARTAANLLERGRRVAPERSDLKATARFVTGR